MTKPTLISILAAIAFAVVPAVHAQTNVTVSGNGVHSYTSVKLINVNTTNVVLQNSMTTSTVQTTTSNSGYNSIKNTTGGSLGDPSITTGAATSKTISKVTGPTNVLTLSTCGCTTPTDVTVKDNGVSSKTSVVLINHQSTNVTLVNEVVTETSQGTASNTGDNKVKNTTGTGTVSIDTGASSSTTVSTVTGPVNMVNPPPVL